MSLHPTISASDVTHYLSSWNSKLSHNIWCDLIQLIQLSRDANPYNSPNSNSSPSDIEKVHHSSLMWEEQTGINFPMMYVASIYLYHFAKHNGCDTFLFATRDCCHWFRIFKKLFPEANSHLFNCSRNMLTRAEEQHNVHYMTYLKSLIKTTPDKVAYVDIHGTCQRILSLFDKEFKTLPYCFLLSASYRQYVEFPSICQRAHSENKLVNVVFDARGTPIEMLNFDVIGTLQNYDARGPIRDPPEYTVKHLEAYHCCIEYLLNQMKPWNKAIPHSIRKKEKLFDMDEMLFLIRRIYRVIQDNKPILNHYIKHPGKH